MTLLLQANQGINMDLAQVSDRNHLATGRSEESRSSRYRPIFAIDLIRTILFIVSITVGHNKPACLSLARQVSKE
jgi:hypothetical protein